jgi:PAS domain-containing protein
LPALGLEADGPGATTLQGWMERVHADDAGQFMKSDCRPRCSPTDPVFDMEYRMRRQDGMCCGCTPRAASSSAAQDGQPELAVGTSMNITGRKQIEQAVRESEARSRNLATCCA